MGNMQIDKNPKDLQIEQLRKEVAELKKALADANIRDEALHMPCVIKSEALLCNCNGKCAFKGRIKYCKLGESKCKHRILQSGL